MEDFNQKDNLYRNYDKTRCISESDISEIKDILDTHLNEIIDSGGFDDEIRQNLLSYMSLEDNGRIWLIRYLSGIEWFEDIIITAYDDIKTDEHEYHPIKSRDVETFDKVFSLLETNKKNNPEAPDTDKFDLFYTNLCMSINDPNQEQVMFLTYLLKDILHISSIYTIIAEMMSEVEHPMNKNNIDDLIFEFKISLQYDSRKFVIQLLKKQGRSRKEPFILIDATKDVSLKNIVDTIVNVRRWESIKDIFSKPCKYIDLIDVNYYLMQKEECNFDDTEDLDD